MLTPLTGKVVIQFDPPPKSLLTLPKEDYIDICKRCGMEMEELGKYPCIGQEIFELDAIHDTYKFCGMDYSHTRERIKRPAGVMGVHPATVEISSHPDYQRGDRVLVSFGSGESIPPDEPLSLTRLVSGGPDGQIIATIEETEE